MEVKKRGSSGFLQIIYGIMLQLGSDPVPVCSSKTGDLPQKSRPGPLELRVDPDPVSPLVRLNLSFG